MNFNSFKNEVTNKLFAYIYIYLMVSDIANISNSIYQLDLTSNNLLELICHKTQTDP